MAKQEIKTYRFMLNVGGAGSLNTEMTNIPAPEMLILRELHGQDSLTEIREDGKVSLNGHDWFSMMQKKYRENPAVKVVEGFLNDLPADVSSMRFADQHFSGYAGGGLSEQAQEAVAEAVSAKEAELNGKIEAAEKERDDEKQRADTAEGVIAVVRQRLVELGATEDEVDVLFDTKSKPKKVLDTLKHLAGTFLGKG